MPADRHVFVLTLAESVFPSTSGCFFMQGDRPGSARACAALQLMPIWMSILLNAVVRHRDHRLDHDRRGGRTTLHGDDAELAVVF
jgi:hypothetical protein